MATDELHLKVHDGTTQNMIDIMQKELETMRTQIARLQDANTKLDQEIRLLRSRLDRNNVGM